MKCLVKLKKNLHFILFNFGGLVGLPTLLTANYKTLKSLRAYKKGATYKNLYFYYRHENFGDWINPYLLKKISNSGINLTLCDSKKNKLGILGSVISDFKGNSTILGCGINSKSCEIDEEVKVYGVRGPFTYDKLSIQQKMMCRFIIDPGFFMPQILKKEDIQEGIDNQVKVFFHINHKEDMLEDLYLGDKSIVKLRASSEYDIERICSEVVNSKFIITTAMHIAIVAIAYEMPCLLIIDDVKNSVSGDGIKYKDAFFEELIKNPPVTKLSEFNGNLNYEKKYILNKKYVDNAFNEFTKLIKEL